MLISAAVLISFSLTLAGLARLTGFGVTSGADVAIETSHAVRFEDATDGSVTVYFAASEQLVTRLPPGTNGFVRGVMRGLARERRMNGVGSGEPFLLNRTVAGELLLIDPSIDRTIDLRAFGPDNFAAFAQIYAAAENGSVVQ